ncbi:MAG: hypothetical protein JXB04_02660 [Kiritimatiellae bacterium]|nr:hypothetical protein [Kiritimatiellia bacterium]
MKLQLRRVMAESNIKRIKKQLAEIDELEAQAKLKPVEQANDTFLAVTYEDQRKKLRKELEKNERILKESAEAGKKPGKKS